jgi:AraC family ethanolamine operon transcriptional activator
VASGAVRFAAAGDVADDVGPARSPVLDGRVSFAVVEDADGYEQSVHGISIRSIRTGRGLGPNRVLAVDADGFVVTSVDVGFPMLNRTSIADDRIAIGFIRSAPGGARWCGIDLQPGTVIMEGLGAKHVGINPPGLSFAFAVVDVGVIEQLADSLGRRFRPPPQGSVSSLAPLPQATAFGDTLSSFVQAAAANTTLQANRHDDVLYRVTALLSDDGPSRPIRRTWRVDPRHLVHTCIDYAEAVARVPSVRELCLATHVSERLLRNAFAEECGMAPTAFFRLWALNQAHDRLLAADRHRVTVTSVAMDLGFCHLSRFANRYRRLFGEPPSATLRSRT